jgi:hypothetical protein
MVMNQPYTDLNECVKQATAANGWFTYENITKAFTDWGSVLTEENLKILATTL